MLWWNFVEIGRVAHRFAAIVHKGLRFHEDAAAAFNGNVGHNGFEFDAVNLHAELLREQIHAEKARIVAGEFIFWPGIAKPNDQKFRRTGRGTIRFPLFK